MRSPKYELLLAGLAVVSFGSFWLALKEQVTVKLEMTPYFHNFGNVQQGSVLKIDVIVANNSDQAMQLGDAIGSCRCFATKKLQGQVLLPKTTITVPITWDISGKRGGAIADMAIDYFISPDGKTSMNPDAVTGREKLFSAFRARAYVEPEYDVVPSKLEFAANKPGETIVHLKRNRAPNAPPNSSMRLVDYGANHEAISVEKIDPHDGDFGTLHVGFKPAIWNTAVYGTLSSLEVKLVTNSKYEPVFVIPVVVRTTSVVAADKR